MKAKTIIPMIIGLGVGFFAIKMGIDMVRRAQGESGATKSVVVAKSKIGVASRVTGVMLTTREIAVALVPKGTFSDPKKLVGRIAKMTIPPGIAVSESMLAPPGASPGLTSKIPSGFRAVSVKVNEASAVAGFLNPGDRVDVFAVRGNRRNNASSRLILSSIQVGAVGQSMSEVASDGKTVRNMKSVTLFLRPEQVPTLDAASTKGAIRLALLGHVESEVEESIWSRMLKRAGEFQPPAPAPEPAPKPVVVAAAPKPRVGHVVEVLHGTRLQRLVFDSSGNLMRDARIASRVPAMPEPHEEAVSAFEEPQGARSSEIN
ncbi:MAG: Flp pilus assembly protein CpaB [Planctomycetota bacterium]|nr:Flp pilus assembly protein CpaB [Planctomycetota bacterium]